LMRRAARTAKRGTSVRDMKSPRGKSPELRPLQGHLNRVLGFPLDVPLPRGLCAAGVSA
jgi:hypothetical protein